MPHLSGAERKAINHCPHCGRRIVGQEGIHPCDDGHHECLQCLGCGKGLIRDGEGMPWRLDPTTSPDKTELGTS